MNNICDSILADVDNAAYGLAGLKEDLIEVFRPTDKYGNPQAAINVGLTWPDAGKVALAIATGMVVGDLAKKKLGKKFK